jgi:hypothetical protein
MNATASIKPSPFAIVPACLCLLLARLLIVPFIPAFYIARWCNQANGWLIQRSNLYSERFRAWRAGG